MAYPLVWHALAYGLLAVTVLVASYTDIARGIVPNWLTLPSVVLALVYWTVVGFAAGKPDQGLLAFGGLFAGLVPFMVLVLMGGLGGGDMKLMAAVGAWTASWPAVLSTTVYALLLGVMWSVVVILRYGLIRDTAARIMTLVLTARSPPARPVADSCTDPNSQLPIDQQQSVPAVGSHPVPFAAVAALGALLAGAEQMLGVQTPWAWLGP